MDNTTKRKFLLVLMLSFVLCLSFAFLYTGVFNAYAATSSEIYLTEGAFIKDDAVEESGLKFENKIKKDFYEGLKTTYGNDNVKAGMIIVPTDYVEALGEGVLPTFNSLNALLEDTGITLAFQETKGFRVVENDTALQYTLSLINIREHNYARAMTAIGYIKVSVGESAAPANAEAYNGDYYIYSSNMVSRSVYETAKNAWSNGSKSEIIKSFIDGVVEVNSTGDGVQVGAILNDYTSPYTVETDANGDYRVINDGQQSKSVFLDGKVVTNPFMKINGKNLYVFNKGFNTEGGNVTAEVTGNQVTVNTTYIQDDSNETRNNLLDFVAFEGKYDVGTYVTVSFQGNNMPYIGFFADKVNGKIFNLNGENNSGVVYMNGYFTLYQGANQNVYGDGRIVGPNRWGDSSTSLERSLASNWWTPIAMKHLINTPETYFTAVIGTEWAESGNLKIVEYLFQGRGLTFQPASGENVFATYEYEFTGITKDDITAGNIILFSPMKGEKQEATFTYTIPTQGYVAPEKPDVSGEQGCALNANGSVTLLSNLTQAYTGNNLQPWGKYSRNIKIEGNYGVGTYIDCEFIGQNMPQLMLFAEKGQDANISNIGGAGSDDTTQYNKKGVVIINKVLDYGDKFMVFGPDRISVGDNTSTGAGAIGMVLKEDYEELTWDGLKADNKYEYTVGTFESGGYVYLHIILKNVTSHTVICDNMISLYLTATELGTGDIRLYAPFVGSADIAYMVDYVSVPYTRQAPETFSTFKTAVALTSASNIAPANLVSSAQEANNGYISLKGQGIIGKTIEIEFSSANEAVGGVQTDFGHLNLPDIVLFADQENGFKGSSGGKGLFLTTGIGSYGADAIGYNQYSLYGPDRFSGGAITVTDKALLTGAGLRADANNTLSDAADTVKTYKFTLTTSYNEEGKLIISISLAINEENGWNTTIGGVDYSNIKCVTVYSSDDIDELGTNVLLMAANKQNTWNSTTVFKYRIK